MGTDHRILNSTFYFNQAVASGCGGLIHTTGTLSIVNSTFFDNRANATFGGGGALCVTGGTATIRNVTISGNSASTGGGIHQTGGTIDVANSIVAGNSASGANPPEINIAAGTFISSGYNLIGDTPGDAANTGTPISYHPLDLLDAPPDLGPLQINGGTTMTMELLAGSIAINSGNNALAVDPFNNAPLLTDQQRIRHGSSVHRRRSWISVRMRPVPRSRRLPRRRQHRLRRLHRRRLRLPSTATVMGFRIPRTTAR